jgi:hypothetical protein
LEALGLESDLPADGKAVSEEEKKKMTKKQRYSAWYQTQQLFLFHLLTYIFNCLSGL